MKYPTCVQVQQAIEKLEEDGLDRGGGNGIAGRLCVMVDDLKQVMLGVLEYHEDAFILQDDFHKVDHVRVVQL